MAQVTIWIVWGKTDTEKNKTKTKQQQKKHLTQNSVSKEPNFELDTLEISSLFYEIAAIIWCEITDYLMTITKY